MAFSEYCTYSSSWFALNYDNADTVLLLYLYLRARARTVRER